MDFDVKGIDIDNIKKMSQAVEKYKKNVQKLVESITAIPKSAIDSAIKGNVAQEKYNGAVKVLNEYATNTINKLSNFSNLLETEIRSRYENGENDIGTDAFDNLGKGMETGDTGTSAGSSSSGGDTSSGGNDNWNATYGEENADVFPGTGDSGSDDDDWDYEFDFGDDDDDWDFERSDTGSNNDSDSGSDWTYFNYDKDKGIWEFERSTGKKSGKSKSDAGSEIDYGDG